MLRRSITVDIRAVASSYASSAIAVRPADQAETAGDADPASNAEPVKQQVSDKNEEKKPLKKQDVEDITDGLNDFMESINTDIRFVLHTKMKELMVQVVDIKHNKVLREAPPKELLDTMAKIRDLVGALLDKKI
jgi:flagellar protein FlaG